MFFRGILKSKAAVSLASGSNHGGLHTAQPTPSKASVQANRRAPAARIRSSVATRTASRRDSETQLIVWKRESAPSGKIGVSWK